MTTPVWQAATAGQGADAGHVNQYLSVHAAQVLYQATQTASQAVNGAAHINTNGLWLAQSFTTAVGQTAVGYVSTPLGSFTSTGSTLPVITLSLYADSGGAPTGTPLVTTTIPTEYVFFVTGGSDLVPVRYPLPATGLTPNTLYWLVTTPSGTAGVHYTWRQSNQTSGASTSPDGVTWTPQTYGFQYTVFDQSISGLQRSTWEDGGLRWTMTTYNANNTIATFSEYTSGQTAAGYLVSTKTYSYSNGFATGWS